LATEEEYSAAGEATGQHYEDKYGDDLQNLNKWARAGKATGDYYTKKYGYEDPNGL
jgi:hypothetical protein